MELKTVYTFQHEYKEFGKKKSQTQKPSYKEFNTQQKKTLQTLDRQTRIRKWENTKNSQSRSRGVCTGFLTKVKNKQNDHALHDNTGLQDDYTSIYNTLKPFHDGINKCIPIRTAHQISLNS